MRITLVESRIRGAIIALNPTRDQSRLLHKTARMRRQVKNYLIRQDEMRLNEAVWKGCIAYASQHKDLSLSPQEVRRMWGDPEQRKELRDNGFTYKVEKVDHYKLTTPWVNESRKRRWMRGLSSSARNQAGQDVRQANQNFLSSLMGKRKGKRVGRPRPERRSSTLRFSFQTTSKKTVQATGVRVPNIGLIKVHENLLKRLHGGEVSMCTVFYKAGRWYVTLRVRNMGAVQVPHGRDPGSVGVDLNVGTSGIVLSTGKKFPVPRRLEELDQEIRRHQRLHRNKQKPLPGQRPSQKWVKQNRQLRKLHEEAARVRENWLQTATTWIVNHYHTVVIEDLNVAGMTRSAKGTMENPGKNVKAKAGLNRKILQAGFASFRWMLSYKLAQTGGQLVVVDQWFPSSQLCNCCGWRPSDDGLPNLSLGTRVFRCGACGHVEDRDKNAARNIRRMYEDSMLAEVSEKKGGECPPWTGRPLWEGDTLFLKLPEKTRKGKKRERKVEELQQAGGFGQPKGESSIRQKRKPSEVEVMA